MEFDPQVFEVVQHTLPARSMVSSRPQRGSPIRTSAYGHLKSSGEHAGRKMKSGRFGPQEQASEVRDTTTDGEWPWLDNEWEWPCYDQLVDDRGNVVERVRRASSKATGDEGYGDPFVVTYSIRPGMPWPEAVDVEVGSPHLVKVLQKVWPTKKKLRYAKAFFIKAREIFLELDELKGYLNGAEQMEVGETTSDEQKTEVQLRHLLRFIEKEYPKVDKDHERMKQQHSVAFDMLWTFIKPGEKVLFSCPMSDDEVCGQVTKVKYRPSSRHLSKWCLHVKMTCYDYNCDSFFKHKRFSEVLSFSKEVPIDKLNLTVCPIRFCRESAKSIEDRLLIKGALFGYLAAAMRYRYMQFKGPLLEYKRTPHGELRLVKENSNGRVMIDLFSYHRATQGNPNKQFSSCRPPPDVIRENKVTTLDLSGDPNRIYAPAIVKGFSFRLKRWGCFSIRGFSEVVFDGGKSWGQLVMEPKLKEITNHLVSENLKKSYGDDTETHLGGLDPIANKGEGCIVACYGPPGTGKTLTAESLAEKLQVPLWSLSISELGVTPQQLEDKLITIFEVATEWHALLLLDEADVYLEKRSVSTDLTRNAMTGIFLRHLEYYKGVLFLTTNRVLTFDDAFRSRISVFLRYPKLTIQQREIIWRNLLSKANLNLEDKPDTTQKHLNELSKQVLNGREIRNAIQNAQTLARAKAEMLSYEHVMDATKVMATSIACLVDEAEERDLQNA